MRILIIDDDAGCRKTATRFFSASGHEAHAAEGGDDGLKKAIGIKPDVILLDLIMPGLSGIETLHMLHNIPQTRHIPVVIITGMAPEPTERQELTFSPNFAGIVEKPASFLALERKLINLLRSCGKETGQQFRIPPQTGQAPA